MDFIKIHEVTELTALSRSAVYQLCKDNQLPHYRLGGSVRFKESEIQDWINSNKKGSETA